MEILYFLLPLVAVVSAIWFTIRQINAASYLRRPVAAAACSANTVTSAADLPPSLEQRYVDWFTSEHASRKRERTGSANDEDFLAGAGFMAGGTAYRPDSKVNRQVL